MIIKKLLLILFVVLIFSACDKKDNNTNENTNTKSEDLSSKGKEIFYMQSNLTGLKCADCHFDGTNNSSNTKYFPDVIKANERTSVFNGMYQGDEIKKTASGANYCWETFMKMGKEMQQSDIDALNAYYASLKGDSGNKNLTSLAVPKPDKTKLKENQKKIASLTPDISNGETKFKETCKFCHGGKTVKRVPSLFDEDFEGNLKSIVYNVRMGSKFMPFYSFEKLSDQDLADITEYILKNQKK